MDFAYSRANELSSGRSGRCSVAIVGAGPVGLCAAIDLAQHGIDCVVLEQDAATGPGSRAICFAKRTLEILDRLGVGERAVQRGVVWNIGKVFLRDALLYRFDLQPESGHKRPAFINLQQYLLQSMLVERAQDCGGVDLRSRSRVVGIAQDADVVTLRIDTPDGTYALACDYVLAGDGARSTLRDMLGLDAKGQVFRDRFLIADVKMAADFPTERWFWFDPPFHRNQSVLLHRQADDIWRIDFQLGHDADPDLERQPERVIPRIRAMLGEGRAFTLEWVSVYTFRCRRMDSFRHGRVFFLGDAAHQVSPFGARGANGGIQDADNLAWKLAAVIRGDAAPRLLDTYDAERIPAADENILNSTRSTDFITPKSHASRVLRDATLQLARQHPFAQRLVNSGRLSLPHTYAATPLNTLADAPFHGGVGPGAPAPDAPLAGAIGACWLIDLLGGRFCALYYAGGTAPHAPLVARLQAMQRLPTPVHALVITAPGAAAPWRAAGVAAFDDSEGRFAARYDAAPGCTLLVRPDQHIAARWRQMELRALREALARALAREFEEAAWLH